MLKFKFGSFAISFIFCLVPLSIHKAAQSQSATDTPAYPSRPIKIIVGFPPGASTDAITRYAADILSKNLNTPVVVENRPGAGGNLASAVTRNSPADGYTLLLAITSHVTSRGLYKSLSYDPVKDFTAISLVARIPFILVANPSFPGKTVADVIAIAKAKPGTVDYATAGIGTSQHLSGEYFARLTGAPWTHIPYKGGAPALIAVAANEVPLGLLTTTLVMPLLKNGAIKPIAIASTKRSPLLPNVPTFAESGFANFTADTWYGLLAPAGTPSAIVNRLYAELSKGLNSREIQDKFAAQDALIINSSPAEFSKIMREDDAKWLEIVREANIRAE